MLLHSPAFVPMTLPGQTHPWSPAAAMTEAIVLCGWHWRQPAFESVLPRPLLPVAQRPLLAHALQWIGGGRLRRATICTSGGSLEIARALRDDTVDGPELAYSEDLTPRGPAGSASDAAARSTSELFLIVESSVLPEFDLARLLDAHLASGAALTIVVQPLDAAELDVQPALPTGIYVCSRGVLASVPSAGFQDIKESLIPRLHAAGARIATYEAESYCQRVQDAATYLAINHRAITRAVEHPESGMPHHRTITSESQVLAHPSARIDETAMFVGPVIVGPSAVVMRDAVIVGPTSIGAGTVVNERALVSRSVLWDRAVVGRDAVVTRSILVQDATVADHARLADAVRTALPARASAASRAPLVRRPGMHGGASPLADLASS